MNVSDAIRQRTSIRAFTPTAVPEALLRELLDVARHAPSGGNLQPWKVIAVAGDERRAVIDAVGAALRANPQGEIGERRVYPDPLWSPYRERRYEVGEALYATLGIARDDKPARYRHFALPEQEMIYCAMALGYADPDALVNALRASRVAVEAFAEFRGF
ncbi:nitroreductase family protein [Pseudomonas kuykendallii]|uniref:Nitroreductase family protein n=1 Tax=Pseudomonas kuykendallii TaxID=1007099 RepID=A0A1H2T5J3_9PSED|nr:nitroreductase family protein [Pseudomonas kuykendallii]MCQ4272097.1 nitroreductase family protein [Pseudomonas kuykendallii]SDW39118.1 Nitroreductase family protein [Pseudomonas kuykendallii]